MGRECVRTTEVMRLALFVCSGPGLDFSKSALICSFVQGDPSDWVFLISSFSLTQTSLNRFL